MSDIVKFPEAKEPPRVVWTCTCGCATFYMLPGNNAECAQCAKPVTDPDAMGWRTADPPPLPYDPPMESILRTVIDFDDPAANLRSCLRYATPAAAKVVIVVSADGGDMDNLHTFRGQWLDTPEEQQWLDDMLARARRMLTERKGPPRAMGDEGGQ
jgi:hypothetical protein